MVYIFDQEPSGGKLDGISRLPSSWVPPFFLISPELHRRWQGYGASPASTPNDLLDPVERNWIETEVQRFGAQPQSMSLIVRSNAAYEGLDQRGLLRSVRCDGTLEAIFSGVMAVFKAAQEAAAVGPIGLIVQIYFSPILSGHLSNERRISGETRRWVCEIESSSQLGKESSPQVIRWRVERVVQAAEKELLCHDRRGLTEVLRSVGKYFHERKERRHLEWLWNGTRVWIAQNDLAPDPTGESPESSSITASPTIKARLQQFKPFSSSDAKRWQKLSCVETFRSMNLPITSLFVLNGSKKIRQLAKGGSLTGLLADLKELTRAPLVIRTDIAGETALFANRTDCVSKPKMAAQFLVNTARQLLRAGVDPAQVCFIAHRFIPARASAFSMATATGNRVSIDALWGLPDGLEFCAHDSFEVDVRKSLISARKIRFKPTFLAALPDNSWKATPTGPSWDWKPSIDDSTVREIAQLSSKLASRLNKTVVIMWLVGIPPGSGHPELIPWRYTTEGEPRQVESVIGKYFLRKPFFVRNSDDLDRLDEQKGPISSVVLKPDGPHLRDRHFLEQLGAAVKARDLRIDLEGSPLSHTYYVLKRTKAHVACVDPITPRSVRRKFAKLVRDKIPIRIQTQGEKVLAISLPKGELRDVLKAKIVEEAMEVLSSQSPDGLQEEMADVLEVLIALCKIEGGSLAALERLAAKKRKKAGGFSKGLMLVQTEEVPLLEISSGAGLFDVGGVKEATDSYQSIVAAGRRLKTRRDRIIIPLVPSVPNRLRGPNRVHFRNPDLEFEVWYREKSVEVILVREKSDISTQLELPFDDSNRA